MTLEKIVDLYSAAMGIHLVPRRIEQQAEGPFKGIKIYKIELWDVSTHKVIAQAQQICQLTTETRNVVIDHLEQELIAQMFKLYASK